MGSLLSGQGYLLVPIRSRMHGDESVVVVVGAVVGMAAVAL